MSYNADYIKTVVQYCREFSRDASEIVEVSNENQAMLSIVNKIMENDTYDSNELYEILPVLDKYFSIILKLYTRNPDSAFLNQMYNRSASLRDICEVVVRG